MAADGSLPTIARDLPPGPFSAWAGPYLTVCAFWPSPGGHGSHGPTLCTPPAERAPQPGGLSPFGETQNPRLVAQPEVLEPLGSVAGRAPWRGGARNLPIQMLTVPPVALRYQRSYPTTRYGGLSRCQVSGRWAFCRYNMLWPAAGGLLLAALATDHRAGGALSRAALLRRSCNP